MDNFVIIYLDKSFYLYNGVGPPVDANFTGILNYTTVAIDDSLIQFINGEVPVSGRELYEIQL